MRPGSASARIALCRSSSGRYQCRSLGTASLPGADTPTVACRYSRFAASSTRDAVYTRTFQRPIKRGINIAVLLVSGR
jgi:hypothetical protein